MCLHQVILTEATHMYVQQADFVWSASMCCQRMVQPYKNMIRTHQNVDVNFSICTYLQHSWPSDQVALAIRKLLYNERNAHLC